MRFQVMRSGAAALALSLALGAGAAVAQTQPPKPGKDACATMRDFSTSAEQPPMISINLFELAGEEKRKLRLLMLPIGMMLKPGFRVIIDRGEPIEGRYDMCFQNAC